MAYSKAEKKNSSVVQTSIGALAVVLAALIIVMMSLVSSIQGTARVVNYAGLVRGKTQRLVKMEIVAQPQDEMLASVESIIDALRNGSAELDIVRLNDDDFQRKMQELADYFVTLKQEIMRVREQGYENTDIIAKSEQFFVICDEATGLAEKYSQKKASSLSSLEKYIIADIVLLMALIGYEFIKALRYAAMNRILQSKVYLDEATGLPNKNKCEELLASTDAADADTGVWSFDLNNLRTINNSMGHEAGDAYIGRFARTLRAAMPAQHFVGRAGGDEFLAITHGLDEAGICACIAEIKRQMLAESEQHPDAPLSYAVGYALASDYENATLRELFNAADKNMYINKNHVKREEAAAEKRQDIKLLRMANEYSHNYSDCIYCDARQDTYRLLRAGTDFLLAADGSYTGAVEQLVKEQVAEADRARVYEALRLDKLCLDAQHKLCEIQYSIKDENEGYGRLTLIYVDSTQDGKLHHFMLAFESIRQSGVRSAGAKEQLTQYYEQLKQSVLENDSYVDALLETADAVYSVNLTSDIIDGTFLNKEHMEMSQSLVHKRALPYEYGRYCREYMQNVTPETMQNYVMASDTANLLARFGAGEKQLAVEYCLQEGERSRWIQKTVLMMENRVYDPEKQCETAVVHAMVLLRDTTELHAREHEENMRLRAKMEEAKSANKAKTDFLNRMSHDMRTPINGVMGMLEIIKRERNNQARVDDCLEKIRISSEHLLSLINDVLDMSKLESGNIKLECVPFDLSELLMKDYALIQSQIAKTGIVLRAHVPEITHNVLMGSPLHLRQIFLNLISNAVKYNKPHGHIDTYVREISSDNAKATVEFIVADTGIGMSEDFVKNQLFEPFTQEHSDARTQYKGTGLGMSIVKALVDRMNGTIDTWSKPGEGTRFTVTLTFDIGDEKALVASDAESATEYPIEGMNVLLVEDNEINMEIAEFYLNDMGVKLIKAWNGQQALDKFRQSQPGTIDAVLMDIMMPVMNGLDATKAIRALDRSDARTVPIIAMTANAFKEDVTQSMEAGMNAHIIKPLKPEELARTLSAYRAANQRSEIYTAG